MNLFKKTTASVALVALVSGTFSTGVAAMDLAEINAATSLADKGFINEVTTVADFRLDATITRAELSKVAAMIAGVTPNDSCEGKFADVTATTPNDWVCGYVEALLEEGLLSANKNYNPERNLSKAEAVKVSLEAAGETVDYSDATWQADFVAHAVAEGYISNFTDYNTAATRGFVFVAADNSYEANNEGDILDDIIDEITGGENGEDNGGDTDNGSETPVSGDDELMVTLSATTPAAATVPGAISGLPVAKFDFTAGSEDVKITSLTVKRTGLSTQDTITSIAVFTDEGRASKGKNDSQENDTQALINLDNGGVVVKAGETKTLTLVADIASSTKINGHEFALSITEVVAEGTNLELASNLTSNTIKIGGVDAPQIKVSTDGSVSNPKIGEESAELFKFKIEGASDEDVTLKSITLKSSENDIDEDFENYVLVNDGDVIATVDYSNGKYVTFNLNKGFVIEEDKTEKFTVKADVVTGAGDSIKFYIDKNLDVRAEGSKFNYGASADITAIEENDTDAIVVQAGKLSLSDIDAPSDKIRADKKNTVLGTVKLRNVAGANLELQKFGFKVVKTNGSGAQHLIDILENVEARINGSAYELTASDTETGTDTATYYDDDLNIVLPQGDVEIIIEADIKEDVATGTELKLDITGTDGSGNMFTVKETEDDKTVTDVTPSSLSFKKVSVITSGAKVAEIPLPADTKAVRGAKDVVIAQFEVEAEEASLVTVDEVKVKLTASGGISGDMTKKISRVALYKGSVSDSNLLDDESSIPGTTEGTVTFNSFRDGKVSIAAKAKQTFVVTIDLVDGADVTGAEITAAIAGVSAEDDDSDDVKVIAVSNGNEITGSNLVQGGKTLTVRASGQLEITADAGNDANKDVKTILAGESATVFSADVSALNEGADVEEVTFTFEGNNLVDFKKTVTSASLYLDGKLIKTNSNSDVTVINSGSGAEVKFNNLTDFIVPQANVEVAVKLNTANIGFEKVGKTLLQAKATKVEFAKVDGESSGKAIELGSGLTNLTANAGAKEFSVVPAVVTPSVATSLNNSSSAEIKITANAGNNRETNSNSVPNTNVNSLKFDLAGTSYATGSTLTLINVDDAGEKVLATIANDYTVTFDLTDTTNGTLDRSISNGGSETFRITIPADNDKTLSLRLIKTGVNYTVAGSTVTTNLTKDIDFGSRKY